ncbi:hypothetical protein [Sphingosinicella sp. CPCC 101087]|uniref:hypothetical protein n=1 Tax=Sphingosinicella sp. CPCC 101087 TaxID=2497754 RepID=UPI00101C45AB|nr:hypothetical protein [Sphingosinicella sp. CPCC 101087]
MNPASNLSCVPVATETPGDEETNLEPLVRPSRVALPTPARSECLTEEWLRQEVETLGRYLDTAAFLLAREPVVRSRFETELGNIRHVERMLVQIAPLINAADKAEAVERITDPALKARLKRKPIVPLFESKH